MNCHVSVIVRFFYEIEDCADRYLVSGYRNKKDMRPVCASFLASIFMDIVEGIAV